MPLIGKGDPGAPGDYQQRGRAVFFVQLDCSCTFCILISTFCHLSEALGFAFHALHTLHWTEWKGKDGNKMAEGG